MRFGLATPSARSFPERMCGTSVTEVSKVMLTCPPSTAATAGAPPLKGTCTTLMPAASLNSSPVRWNTVPLPEEAMVSCPGFDFASATSSLTEVACTEGSTASTTGSEATTEIGAKSFCVS